MKKLITIITSLFIAPLLALTVLTSLAPSPPTLTSTLPFYLVLDNSHEQPTGPSIPEATKYAASQIGPHQYQVLANGYINIDIQADRTHVKNIMSKIDNDNVGYTVFECVGATDDVFTINYNDNTPSWTVHLLENNRIHTNLRAQNNTNKDTIFSSLNSQFSYFHYSTTPYINLYSNYLYSSTNDLQLNLLYLPKIYDWMDTAHQYPSYNTFAEENWTQTKLINSNNQTIQNFSATNYQYNFNILPNGIYHLQLVDTSNDHLSIPLQIGGFSPQPNAATNLNPAIFNLHPANFYSHKQSPFISSAAITFYAVIGALLIFLPLITFYLYKKKKAY